MEIELNHKSLIAEIVIKSGNTTIVEDLANISHGKAHIPDTEIIKFINIARDMNWFNGKSDIDFIKCVMNYFLDNSEREEFLNNIR